MVVVVQIATDTVSVIFFIKNNVILRRAELKHENFNDKHPLMVGEYASSRWIKAPKIYRGVSVRGALRGISVKYRLTCGVSINSRT